MGIEPVYFNDISKVLKCTNIKQSINFTDLLKFIKIRNYSFLV